MLHKQRNRGMKSSYKLIRLIVLTLACCPFESYADAVQGQINVMQFNLHNAVFSGDGAMARQEAVLMNEKQLDIITTEENSTPDQQPRNLLDYGLDKHYALCGGLNDASLFYNTNRWTCADAITFDVTPNVGFGAGKRQVTVGILQPKNPSLDPLILAATSHWCVTWSYNGQYSYCGSPDHNPNTAHLQDADTFSQQLDGLLAKPEYQSAFVIFGGDLNTMTPDESNALIEKMRGLNYLTANPYDENGKLKPTMGGTPDLIFYKDASSNNSNTLSLSGSEIDPMNHLSDHGGAVIALFNYMLTQ